MSVLLAMLIDRWFGEPPARLHPVVWIGRYLGLVGRNLPKLPPARAFLAGTACWLAGAGVGTGLFALAAAGLAAGPFWLECLGTALLLKPLFALRLLVTEVAAVETALGRSLEDGRRRLAMIVSRDPAQLSAAEVRESALESLSENLSDSLVAPLFWFALFGLPGAALYRFANTADAMWGYRGAWEWAGKWAARADDVLNFVPARLTALGLWCLGPAGSGGLRWLAHEAGRTPSPNSGWPMAALAGALRVRLGKPGVYVLNPAGASPGTVEVARGLRLVTIAGWTFAGLIAAGLVWAGRWSHA